MVWPISTERLRLLVATLSLSLVLLGGRVSATPSSSGGAPITNDISTKPAKDPAVERRLLRVRNLAKQRRQNRTQRRLDHRQALRRRLGIRLAGMAITDPIRGELKIHAKRTAQLRRIRQIAAEQNNVDAVVASDRALAREHIRHQRFWQAYDRQNFERQNQNKAMP